MVTEKTMRENRWTTSDEITFLNGLGTWKESHWKNRKLIVFRNTKQTVNRGLRLKYKASMALRKNWGEINPVDILLSLVDLP